ncbi:hypothetical protein ACDJ24_09510 [Klebsiella pneumoniae]
MGDWPFSAGSLKVIAAGLGIDLSRAGDSLLGPILALLAQGPAAASRAARYGRKLGYAGGHDRAMRTYDAALWTGGL